MEKIAKSNLVIGVKLRDYDDINVIIYIIKDKKCQYILLLKILGYGIIDASIL